MKKLFAVVLGGRADGCNTELHDVVFVSGETFEETYPQLKERWFGNKKRLHIDSYVELKCIDGHQVSLQSVKPKDKKKIFFANFGGYRPNHFGEIHETSFYVSTSKTDVLARAKQEIGLSLVEAHCDDNLIVDDMIELETIDGEFVHLDPSDKQQELEIHSGYIRLG